MSRVEVLVACMQQSDDSLYKKMNLQTNAVLANQCDTYGYNEYIQENGDKVKLVSTLNQWRDRARTASHLVRMSHRW